MLLIVGGDKNKLLCKGWISYTEVKEKENPLSDGCKALSHLGHKALCN